MGPNLKSLIGKLNDPARSALEAAAGLCLSRTHYDIEVEHYLMKLLDSSDNDFASIARHFEVDKSRLAVELTRSLDKLKSGNARTPAISPTILKMLVSAWTLGSIDFNAGQIRTGFTILALVADDELLDPALAVEALFGQEDDPPAGDVRVPFQMVRVAVVLVVMADPPAVAEAEQQVAV